MKNDWKVWGIVGGVIVIVFLIFTFQARQEVVSLGPTLSQPQAAKGTYDFIPSELSVPVQESAGASTAAQIPAKPEAKYAIQIASFADQAKADLAQKKAAGNGLSAYTVSADLGEKGKWHRVYVGPYATQDEAFAALPQVKASYQNGFVISVK